MNKRQLDIIEKYLLEFKTRIKDTYVWIYDCAGNKRKYIEPNDVDYLYRELKEEIENETIKY